MRRPHALVVLAAVSLLLAVAAVLDVRRDREWAHGGDPLRVEVELRLPEPAGVPAAARDLGWSGADGELPVPVDRAVVVGVRWHGERLPGRYQMVALDESDRPPRILRARGGWDRQGPTGSNWAGAYGVLAERYDWLAGTAPVRRPGGFAFPGMAIGTPADADGSLIGLFALGRPTHPAAGRDITLAIWYVDPDGEVRWAKRVRPVTSG